MKFSNLILLVLITVSASVFAKNKAIYGDVQVTNISPTSGFIWKRLNLTPLYPMELARSGITGCAVLSFEISESGNTENVEIINSIPKKQIGKYSRKMLEKWEWTPVSKEAGPTREKRTLRLDYCIGEESTEQSEKACKQQTKLACN